MDSRDRDRIFAKLDRADELIVDLQHGMLTEDQRQSREFEEAKRTIELLKLEPKKGASAATKAKVIGTVLGSVIVYVITAAIQNGWFADPKPKDPGELPIPVSTYELPSVST